MTQRPTRHEVRSDRRAGRARTRWPAILASALRLGVELDEHEAAQWVAAMEAEAAGGDVVVDVDTGVYGHRGHDARLLAGGAGAVPRHRQDRRLRRPAAAWRPPSPCRDPRRRARSRATRATATTSSASTSRPNPATAACAILRDLMREKALVDDGRADLPAVGGQVRRLPVRRASATAAEQKPGWTDLLVAGRGARRPVNVEPGRPAGRRSTLGRARRPDTGWCKLDWIVADPVAPRARQRQQRARRDLGGARRHDHAARRLHRPLLPGGLPRGRVAAALHASSSRKLSADAVDDYVDAARARGLEVQRRQGRPRDQLRQGRAADVQHLPPDRPLRRGSVPARAVRRADDGPLPGRGADPHDRRGRPAGRRIRHRDAGLAGRRADHVGDRGPRGQGGGRHGRATCCASATRWSRREGGGAARPRTSRASRSGAWTPSTTTSSAA